MNKTKLGLPENFEAALAYSIPIIAFITGFALLILERENKLVRFHAMQSFIVFGFFAVLSLVTGLVVGWIPLIGAFVQWGIATAVIISWLILILSALTGKYFKFPFVGDAIYNKMVL